MNLEKHKEAILKWVASCETHEQLNLLISVTINYISVERFPDEKDKKNVELSAKEILQEIDAAKWLLTSKKEVNCLTINPH